MRWNTFDFVHINLIFCDKIKMESEERQQQHLPVFVQPTEVNFVIDRPETHKCLLTIFNPYPFAIQFRVLCNAPAKYTVGMTRGTIRQGCYIDTTIRHKNPCTVESDCLRIEIYRLDEDLLCGLKEIPLNVQNSASHSAARLLASQQRLMEFDDGGGSSSASGSSRSRTIPSLSRAVSTRDRHEPPNAPNFYWLAILSFLFCISVLLLPPYVEPPQSEESRTAVQNQQLQQQWIPNWVRPTSTSKCVSAYVLGILTVYFFLQPAA